MSLSEELVVLGAGPAGLAAALTAARAGRSVVVVEGSDRIGGMAASIEVGGQRVDLGSHRLHRASPPAVMALVQELLGDDLQPRPRSGRIRLGGRWLGFPLRPLDVLRHAPPALSIGFACDLVTAPWRSTTTDTFAEQVRAGPGPTLLDRFYAPYARKLWDRDPDALSGELFRRRVGARSAGSLAARVLRRRSDQPGFWYPRRGFGQVVDALADAAVDAGVDIRCGEPLVDLRRAGDRWCVTTSSRELDAPLVVSTIPNRALVDTVDAPAPIRDAAGELTHRGALLVYLVVERDAYTPFDAHYFPEPDVTMARLSEPKNYRDGDDPPGVTVLCAEIAASVGDGLWSASDDDLAADVASDLARSGLPPVDGAPSTVVRLPNVYPVYDLGAAAAQHAVEAWVSAQPGLALVGRQALFAHDNTHHALEMGITAGRLAGASTGWDPVAWSAARHRFRDHVVED